MGYLTKTPPKGSTLPPRCRCCGRFYVIDPKDKASDVPDCKCAGDVKWENSTRYEVCKTHDQRFYVPATAVEVQPDYAFD